MKKKNPLNYLIDTCHLVSSSLDLEEVLKGVTRMSKDFIKAEAGSLMLLDESGQTLSFAVALGKKGNRLKKNFSLRLGQGIAGWVAKKGTPLVVPDVKKDPRFYKEPDKATGFISRSILAVPLKTRDKTIGVLEILNPEGKTGFSEDDIPMFEAFASQVAVAIENARMHKKILEQQKLEQELSIASEIQEHILPRKKLQSRNISVMAEYKAAKKIGGDFFNIIDLEDKIIVTIGDVSGKGIPAALYMVRLITELRSLVMPSKDISLLVYELNNALLQRSTLGMFATAIIVSIDKAKKEATIVNAGHLDLLGIKGIKVNPLKIQKGLPLGILEKKPYSSTKKILKNGDSLLLYTDGIIEARNRKGKEFGPGRLAKAVRNIAKTNEKDPLKKLFTAVTDFSKGAPQHDDLTAVLISYNQTPMAATTLKIKSNTKNLKDIRLFIRNVASYRGFSKQEADGIVLAVDEACTNIIRHAYAGDSTKDIIITTEAEPDKLVVTLRDFGEKPDLRKLENPPPEKLRKGRYGVIFIKKIMDEVEYDLSPEKGTILRLIKYKK